MSVYSDKFEAVAAKLDANNGEPVDRLPSDGSGPIALQAWAFVEGRTERRQGAGGSEMFVRIGNLRFVRGTVALDDDGWTIRGERWDTKHIVLAEPSVRVYVERPVSRTVGGPALAHYAAES